MPPKRKAKELEDEPPSNGARRSSRQASGVKSAGAKVEQQSTVKAKAPKIITKSEKASQVKVKKGEQTDDTVGWI
jgi:hypothetical protein